MEEIEIAGERYEYKNVTDIANQLGIHPSTVYSRLSRGISLVEALTNRIMTNSESAKRNKKRCCWGLK